MNGNVEASIELRQRIAEACRVLGVLDITLETLGHVSARLPGTGRIFIRARGPAESGVRYTTSEDVIEVDVDGHRVDDNGDGRSAPMEVHIHTELYRRRPDVHSVVHVHPASAVLLTIGLKELMPIYGSFEPLSMLLVADGVPTFEKSTLIRTPELGRELARCMGSSPTCLMRGHGVTTAANSIEDATLFAIQLNTMAAMTCQAHMLGQVDPIPAEEQEDYRQMRAAMEVAEGLPRPGMPLARHAPLWRYYTRLAAERTRL